MSEQSLILYIATPTKNAQKTLEFLLPKATRPDFDDEVPEAYMAEYFETIDDLPYPDKVIRAKETDIIAFWEYLNEEPKAMIQHLEDAGLPVKLVYYTSDDIELAHGAILCRLVDGYLRPLQDKLLNDFFNSENGLVNDFITLVDSGDCDKINRDEWL